jgi:Ser/Thr protein kinase RdoA (MazF antagonist)
VVGGGDDLAAVRGYAAEVVGCSADRVTATRRFEDGNRHAVHEVSYLDAEGATASVVVRVSSSSAPDERAQAEREARVLEHVGVRAAPKLHDFRLSSRWFGAPAMCMQFVPGRKTDVGSAPDSDLERLGSVVAWVHGQPADDLVEEPSPRDITSYAEERLLAILETLAWVRDPLPATIQSRARQAADAVERSLEARRDDASFRTDAALALLHGDIAAGNVLWGSDPVLIDWEYARVGDPADELAYTFDQNGLTTGQRASFWRGYRAGVPSPERLAHIADRVSWWEPVTLLGSTLWWTERWVRRIDADAARTSDPAAPKTAAYYADRATSRLTRLEGLTRPLGR